MLPWIALVCWTSQMFILDPAWLKIAKKTTTQCVNSCRQSQGKKNPPDYFIVSSAHDIKFLCERVFLMDRSSWPLCVRSTPGTEAVSGTRQPAAAKTAAALRGPSSSTLPTPPPRNPPFTTASRCQENPYQRRITEMTPRYSCDGDLFTGAALNCAPNKKGMRAALWRCDLLL